MNINQDHLQTIMLVVISGFLITLLVILTLVLRKINWANSKKILDAINPSDFEIFDYISIQISSFSTFRVVSGIPQKAKIFINNSKLIILHKKKPTLFDINFKLPLTILNSKNKEDCEIKIFTPKKLVIIILNPSKSEFFKIRQEINIIIKDKNDFERFRMILRNWF